MPTTAWSRTVVTRCEHPLPSRHSQHLAREHRVELDGGGDGRTGRHRMIDRAEHLDGDGVEGAEAFDGFVEG